MTETASSRNRPCGPGKTEAISLGSPPCGAKSSRAGTTARLACAALFGALTVACSVAAAEGPADIGFVVEYTCEWTVTTQTDIPVVVGATVPGGAELIASNVVTQPCSITIALLNDTLVKHECAGNQDCAFRLPSTLQTETSVARRLVRAIGHLFSKEPERYVSALSRGEGLRDGVAELGQQGLDIGHLLEDLPSGVYTLHFSPLKAERPTAAVVQATLEWKRGQSGVVAVPSLVPGLYAVTVTTGRAQASPDETAAWVLVAEPPRARQASVAWKEAETKVAEWRADLSGASSRALLRAFLESLAVTADEAPGK